MTYEFEYMMYLSSCGAKGEAALPPLHDVDFGALYKKSSEQSVIPFVSYAIKISGIDCSEKYNSMFAQGLRNSAVAMTRRKRLIIDLLSKFEQNNIRACILKGFAVAECYAVPECRASADTDILIAQKDEKKTCTILKNHGFTIEKRHPLVHHTICYNPQIGTIELHIALYSENDSETMFCTLDQKNLMCDTMIKYDSEDGQFYSLGHTDHIIFLVIHTFKHFITSGMNLRTMLDIAMYYTKYKEAIDMKRLWANIALLDCENFISALFGAMVRYCGFDESNFEITEIDENKVGLLIDDLEKCSGISYYDKSRTQSGLAYREIRSLQTQNKYLYYLRKLRLNYINKLFALFPPRYELAKKYPYALKYPILISYAWFSRLFSYFYKHTLGKKNNRQNTVEMSEDKSNERLEMFRKLGIL